MQPTKLDSNRPITEYRVKDSNSRDTERAELNRILSDINSRLSTTQAPSSPGNSGSFSSFTANASQFVLRESTGNYNLSLAVGGVAGTNINFSTFTSDDVVEGATNLFFTDERAQDAVGLMVNSTLTYVDGTPSLGINLANPNSWTAAQTFTRVDTPLIHAASSAGIVFQSNSSTNVADFGAGGGSNATFFGGVNIDGQTRLATSLTGYAKLASGVVSAQTGVPYSDLTSIPAAIDAIDGLTPAADRLAYYTGASTAALTTLTSFARTLLDDADATTMRSTLGLGTMATEAAADYVTLATAQTITGAKALGGYQLSGFGSYGVLEFSSTSAYTGSARRWLMTNAYNGNSFALIRSADANTSPALNGAGGIAAGALDVSISNAGVLTAHNSAAVVGVLSVTGAIFNDDGVNGRITLENTASRNQILSTTTGFGAYKTLRIYADATNYTEFNSGGVAVTGALSCTGNFTAGDSYGDSHAVNGSLYAGDAASTSGSVIIRGHWSGAQSTVILGGMYSSGGAMLGYCVRPDAASSAGFLSTVDLTIARTALVLDGDGANFYSTSSSASSSGAAVSMTRRLRVGHDTLRAFGIPMQVHAADPYYMGLSADSSTIYGYVQWASSAASAYLWTQANWPLLIGTNNVERMRVTAGGNVLIGTTTDSGEKLHVAGAISAATSHLTNDVYQITAVTTAAQTRTVDLANGEVQTLSVNQNFTLNATGPSGKAGLVKLYVYNSGGADAFFGGGTGWFGLQMGGFGVTPGSTAMFLLHWDGTRMATIAEAAEAVGNVLPS